MLITHVPVAIERLFFLLHCSTVTVHITVFIPYKLIPNNANYLKSANRKLLSSFGNHIYTYASPQIASLLIFMVNIMRIAKQQRGPQQWGGSYILFLIRNGENFAHIFTQITKIQKCRNIFFSNRVYLACMPLSLPRHVNDYLITKYLKAYIIHNHVVHISLQYMYTLVKVS